ncbi:MAG: hydantoinase/oxoprolinase family protein [Armatimonadota bacterium]|nr:hydantoinase/oxoprolinase family protein [Armatimonadota bacterium]
MSIRSTIGLGIDAGGTYTDAVLCDMATTRLLAKAKALTTYHNLVEGIREALGRLPRELLARAGVTSLSTTLATNSVVEGRGHKVGLIVLSPWDWFAKQIGHEPCVEIPGATAITGQILQPLDEDACREAVEHLVARERCAALVVAGYAMVRNPEQANRVREIASEMCDVPLVCAHELSRRLNAVRGAQTAVANAKLLPVIRDLIASVRNALEDFGVSGRLMVVKGDGTPVEESVARARPIETVLSGPAASVSGARILTGLEDALVLDIGGTTTDCAIIQNGQVAVSPDGARVGPYVMNVDVADILTVGLGGDSRIDFTRDRKIRIGPVRNIPLAYLAHEHKSVEDFLTAFDVRRHAGAYDASAMDVLVLASDTLPDATRSERRLIDLLRGGPIPATVAAKELKMHDASLLPVSRLEAVGAVKRSALTPTDLLHVTGQFTTWNVDAATRALGIFSTMFGRSPEEIIELAMRAVTRRLFEEIVRREVSWENHKLHDLPKSWGFLIDKAFAGEGDGLDVRLSIRRPIVAIGAPAEALVSGVGERLGVEIIVPEHADVANAIGAIGSRVVVREEITISPTLDGTFTLHGSGERMLFRELEPATEKAMEISRARALERAVESGAQAPEVTVLRDDRSGAASDGGSVFIERRITAVASGGAFG